MEQLFDEVFNRFRDYQEVIDSEPAPAKIYGPKITAAQLRDWELNKEEHINEYKGRAIDALNDYIDKRIRIYINS